MNLTLRTLLTKKYISILIAISMLIVLLSLSLYQISLTNKLQRDLSYKEKLLNDMLTLETQYNQLKHTHNNSFNKNKINLFSLINRIIKKDNLTSNVVFIRPFSRMLNNTTKINFVEIKLKNMTTKLCTKFLYDTEESYKDSVFLKRIQIKKENSGSLSVNAVFFVYEQKVDR